MARGRPRRSQHGRLTHEAIPTQTPSSQTQSQAQVNVIENPEGLVPTTTTPEAQEPKPSSQADCQEAFYRQLGGFVQKISGDFPSLVFNAEEILHTFQSNGLSIVSGQHLVEDSKAADFGSDAHVLHFVSANLTSLDKIIDFCLGVANGSVSVDRFVGASVLDLAQSMQDLYPTQLNPFARTTYIQSPFGEFAVENVSSEAMDLKQRQLMQKFHDFSTTYQVGSWLFDAGCELLQHVLLPSISHEQCVSLALVCASVWTQFRVLSKRLVQIEQLSSADVTKRMLASVKYKRKVSSLLLDKEALDIEERAAQITAKQVSERLKSAASRGDHTSRGQFSFVSRGRGRFGRRSFRPTFSDYGFSQQSTFNPSFSFSRGRNSHRGGHTPFSHAMQSHGQTNRPGPSQDQHKT